MLDHGGSLSFEQLFVGDVEFFGFREQVLAGDAVCLEERHHVKGVADRVVRDGVELHAFGGPEGIGGHAFGEEGGQDARAFNPGAWHQDAASREE